MRYVGIVCLTLTFISGIFIPRAALGQSADQNVQDLRNQLDDLREQMNKIQARLDQLGTAQATASTSTPSAVASHQQGTIESTQVLAQIAPSSTQAVGEQTATYNEFSEDTVAAPRFDNVPLDRKYEGFFQLPGTQTILKIGGYFKSDFIRDWKAAGNTDAFVPSSFPVPQVPGVYNVNVSIRPTRLSLDFRIPTTQIGEVRFYLEGDLFGTNATTPRLRHAYAQALNFLVGQTFTNFMDPDAFPDTLDFQGPNGMVNLRNPQFRYGLGLRPGMTLYVSIEKPSPDVTFSTPQFAAQPNAPHPDGTVRLRQEYQRGHVRVATIFRSIAASLPNGQSDTVFGWGFNVSADVKTFGRDNIILAAAGGHGISRYIQDTSGLGIDAEPSSTPTPHLQATRAAGLSGAYQHYWSKTWRSSAFYSYAAVHNTALEPLTTYNHATYTGGNLIWNPSGSSLNVGAEFLYGWKVLQNGEEANDPRLQFSAKYSFVKTKTER